jgi:stage II sporulation protein E
MKIKKVLIHIIGLLVARAAFYSMNPLAIGYFTASYLSKAGGGWAFAVAIIGIISSMNTTGMLKYSLALISSVIIMETPFMKGKNVPKQILVLLPSVALTIFSMMEITSGGPVIHYIAMAVLEGLIAFLSAGMFRQGIEYIMESQKGTKMNNEQMVSMALTIAVILYAIPEIQSDYLAPAQTVAYFIILFFTYKYGAGQGAITAALCGFALCLRGAPIGDVGVFSLMSIVTAVFREMGRFPSAGVYLLIPSVLGLVDKDLELSIQKIGALMSAVVLFCLLPSGLIYRVDAAGGTGKQEQLATQNLRKIAKLRMKIFAESFLKLSKTLDTITEQQTKLKQKEVNRIFEEISEKLCRDCEQCPSCWESRFEQTYQAASQMFEIAEKKGTIRIEDIPVNFLDSCISIDDFIKETNRGFEIAKLNQIWHSRISESREVIAEQLKEVSTVIQDITGEIYEAAEVSRAEEERVARRLRQEHISVKDITILEREDRRKEIFLTASCRGGRCITAKEAAIFISEALDVKVKPSEASKSVISKECENYSFLEDTKFKVLTGVARAMKENVSGDNFSILPLENGEFMLALSDGMGTGKEAGEESETVMSLLEQMIGAGFKAETAIKLINSSLVLKADKQTFSTIDMSIINLFTGMCEFIKIGAAAAFIKRGDWVETIASTTLPIGMFGNVDYDTVTKKLYEGDIIVLVTDGVLDCIPGEKKESFIEQMLLELKSNNPQEIANRILDRTLSLSNYVPMDDMTVITAGIWLK